MQNSAHDEMQIHTQYPICIGKDMDQVEHTYTVSGNVNYF